MDKHLVCSLQFASVEEDWSFPCLKKVEQILFELDVIMGIQESHDNFFNNKLDSNRSTCLLPSNLDELAQRALLATAINKAAGSDVYLKKGEVLCYVSSELVSSITHSENR